MMYSTHGIAWRIFLLSLGVSFFVLPLVNSQDLEVDIAPAAPSAVNYDEDVIDGAFYFRLMCWGCHAGETRGGKAPDLFRPQWLYGWTDDGIFKTVFNGLPGTQMQKFGGKLSDEAIEMIVGYVRSEQAKAAGFLWRRYNLLRTGALIWRAMSKLEKLSSSQKVRLREVPHSSRERCHRYWQRNRA